MFGVRLHLPACFPSISPPFPQHGFNLSGTTCQTVFAPYLHSLGFPKIATHSYECLMIPD